MEWRSGVGLKVARKLAMVEADLERAEERAEAGEKFVPSSVTVPPDRANSIGRPHL